MSAGEKIHIKVIRKELNNTKEKDDPKQRLSPFRGKSKTVCANNVCKYNVNIPLN